MEKIVLFKNWTKEDFTHTWNKEPHTFKAGESKHMEDWKAEHFAGHLADRELTKAKLVTTDPSKKEMIKKALSGAEEVSKEKIVSELAEKNTEKEEQKQETKEEQKEETKQEPKEEQEFPDLEKDETPQETRSQGSKK